MRQPTQHIGLVGKIGYASGNYGKSLVWSTLEAFLLFYLTDLLGLDARAAGLVIMIGLVWDGVSDPLMGVLSDRTFTRIGRYGPYLLAGAPFCALAFALVFSPPPAQSASVFAYVLAVNLVFRSCYTVCDVPHNALLARVTTSSQDRSFLSGVRFLFSSLGGLSVAAASAFVLAAENAEGEAQRFQAFALIAGGAYVVTIYIAWLATWRTDRAHGAGVKPQRNTPTWRALVGNPQLIVLLTLTLIGVVTFPLFQKSLIYFAKYNLGDETWASWALGAMTASQAASIPAWIWASRRYDKHVCLRWAYLGSALAFAAAPIAAVFSVEAALVATGAAGVGVAGVVMLIWAMIPDTVDFGEWITGRRAEGAAFGVFTFILKSGAGVGAALLGVVMSASGFSPNADQEPDTLRAIAILMGGVPAMGMMACAGITARYRLSHSAHRAIVARLASPSSAKRKNAL